MDVLPSTDNDEKECINIDDLKIKYKDIDEKIDFSELDKAIESICNEPTTKE